MDLLDLPETDDGGSAAEVYLVGMEPRRRGRVRTVVYAGLDLWCALSGGSMELSRGLDVVIRLREDGGLVRRVPVRDPAEAAVVVEQVRTQLDGLTPAEFRSFWELP